jgi:hypothetical protein
VRRALSSSYAIVQMLPDADDPRGGHPVGR